MEIKKAIVAGHTCLDLIPDLSTVPEGQFRSLLQPGRLIKTGRATLTTGGAAPNTGLALQKLGVPVTLIGKIGNDFFGQAVQTVINATGPGLAENLVIDPNLPTAYTIILNPPGFDRTFLHCPGANDFFYASDLPRHLLQDADLFHFGYPNLMRSIFRHDGAELTSIMRRAQGCGVTTSLDFSLPDPTSPAGKADWPAILENSLRFVDIVTPSIEELTFMLDPKAYQQLCHTSEDCFLDAVSTPMLDKLSAEILTHGVKIVMIKMGHRGIYLRTAKAKQWRKSGRGLATLDKTWFDRTLWHPAFSVAVKGTTGAGDSAVAGFLASLLRGDAPETALALAAASGASSVESADSLSGIHSWAALRNRMQSGWPTLPLNPNNENWTKAPNHDLWYKS